MRKCMRNMNFIFLFLIVLVTNTFGQANNFEIRNSTGKNIYISESIYSKDSIKTFGMLRLCKELKGKSCAMTGVSNLFENYIRVDIVAVDDSTKDTLYVKSFNNAQIHSLPFIINITSNDISKLPKDLATHPFLQIKTESQQKIFTLNDPIDVKLINNDKIKGYVKSYDKEKLVVEDLDKKIIIIPRKELAGIKICGPVFAIGARVSFIHNCNYSDVSKSKYKIVRQVFVVRHNGTEEFEWKE